MRDVIVEYFMVALFLLGLLYPWQSVSQSSDALSKPAGNMLNERPQGFYNITTFSVDPFLGPFLNGMQTICGYRINPHILIGVGTGLERYVSMPTYGDLTANLSLLPVFVDIRYIILEKKVSPVIALNGGYKILLNIPSSQLFSRIDTIFPGFAWNEFYEYDTYTHGGFFLTVEAGIKIPVYKRISIYGSLDYSVWSISGDHNEWLYQYLPDSNIGIKMIETHTVTKTLAYTHILLFRLGIMF